MNEDRAERTTLVSPPGSLMAAGGLTMGLDPLVREDTDTHLTVTIVQPTHTAVTTVGSSCDCCISTAGESRENPTTEAGSTALVPIL